MKLLWGAQARDFLYAGIHTVLWVVAYTITIEFTGRDGSGIGMGVVISFFACLYLTVFYSVRAHAWWLLFLSYAAFGFAIDSFDSYDLFHVDAIASMGKSITIVIHALVYAGPIMLSKLAQTVVQQQRK